MFTLQLQSWIVYLVVRLIYATARVRVAHPERRQKAAAESPSGAVVLALWHEHAMASIISHKDQNIHPVVSLSKDGAIVDFTASRFGNPCIRGSSSRGGRQARDNALITVEKGESVAITVDGPKGPRHEVKAGCVDVARKSGCPILPFRCIASKSWILRKTWDQTRIVKFFAKITIIYGEPIWVDRDISVEGFTAKLAEVKAALHQLEQEAI